MSCEPVIRLQNLHKCYQLYAQPIDRLKQFLWRGRRSFYREFWALRDINLHINPGEVVGIMGRNGAGKSTLLQLVCGTLTPSSGEIAVNGRIAALLELGAGFNPEFSGRENVYMNAAIMGLAESEIAAHFDAIVDFSGIRDFIDQPVKTYSSGMYVRLAFAVAIHVSPDILIIDEALSVGDGEFARKSFDRIMALKNAGKTILFCSHSIYQIEALCDRAIWLEQGRIKMAGSAADVAHRYNRSLQADNDVDVAMPETPAVAAPPGTAHIRSIEAEVAGHVDHCLTVRSRLDSLILRVRFDYDRQLPPPSVIVTFSTADGLGISSLSSYHDQIDLLPYVEQAQPVTLHFPDIPLLKGEYFISVYLGCENALHCYDSALNVIKLQVTQSGTEQGFMMLPHQWQPPATAI